MEIKKPFKETTASGICVGLAIGLAFAIAIVTDVRRMVYADLILSAIVADHISLSQERKL